MMLFHPSFTTRVKKDVLFFQSFNLLSSFSRGGGLYLLSLVVSNGEKYRGV